METTAPKTGSIGNIAQTSTMGGLEANRAADRVHSAVDQTAQAAHSAVDKLAAKAEPALNRVRSAASDVATTAYTKYDDFVNSDDWAESARTEIRAHPLAVVGIALLAGLLIGRL